MSDLTRGKKDSVLICLGAACLLQHHYLYTYIVTHETLADSGIVQGTLNEIMSSQKQQHLSQQQQALFKWLSPLNPSARHVESRKKRVEGTGTWLLEDQKFLDWSSGKAKYQIFPCYGDPGAGKTIIA